MKRPDGRRARQAVLSLVAGFALATGTAGAAGAQDLSCTDGATEVRTLEFEGNEAFGDAELANGVVTSPSSWFRRTVRVAGPRRCLDRTQLSLDSLRLLLFYRKHGFPRVTVGTELVPRGERAIDLTIRITEGAPMVVERFEVAGLEAILERERLVRDLPLRDGGRFDQYAV